MLAYRCAVCRQFA